MSYILALIIAAEGTPHCGITEAALADVGRVGVVATMQDVRADRGMALSVMRAYLGMWCTRERLGRDPDVLDYMATYKGGPSGALNRWDYWHYWKQGERNLNAARRVRR